MSGPSSEAPLLPERVLNLDDEAGITKALFREFALGERSYHSRGLRWPTEFRRLPDLGQAIASGRSQHSEARIVRRGSVLCHIRMTEGFAQVSLAAPQEAALDRAEQELRDLIPQPPERSDDDRSSVVRFWYHAPHGATAIARRTGCRTGSRFGRTTREPMRDQLTGLMGWRPGDSGRLVLWHGPLGTGKTYALRALTWHWRDWCEPHYIIDPERFFGARPDYMLEVLLDRADDRDVAAAGEAPPDPAPGPPNAGDF